MNALSSKISVLEILVGHCQVLAKARDPHRRIAASEVEIELANQLEQARQDLRVMEQAQVVEAKAE